MTRSAPIGNMIPNVPQLVPVENAIKPAIKNNKNGKYEAEIELLTKLAR